jgi:hypothetical protein
VIGSMAENSGMRCRKKPHHERKLWLATSRILFDTLIVRAVPCECCRRMDCGEEAYMLSPCMNCV